MDFNPHWNSKHGAEVYNKLRMYFVQMPLFDKEPSELATPLEVFGEPVFRKAFAAAEFAAMTEEEEREYLNAWDAHTASKGMIDTAREEGEAKGFAEGKAEGRAEGRAEANFETARRMKALGIPPDTIATATGLPAEQIARELCGTRLR